MTLFQILPVFLQPYSCILPSIASPTFTWNALCTGWCLLWISLWSGSYEQTPKSMLCFEGCSMLQLFLMCLHFLDIPVTQVIKTESRGVSWFFRLLFTEVMWPESVTCQRQVLSWRSLLRLSTAFNMPWCSCHMIISPLCKLWMTPLF